MVPLPMRGTIKGNRYRPLYKNGKHSSFSFVFMLISLLTLVSISKNNGIFAEKQNQEL